MVRVSLQHFFFSSPSTSPTFRSFLELISPLCPDDELGFVAAIHRYIADRDVVL
jgi:hypothetical protein